MADKRVFACAFDWPGWCRSGKNEQQALDALAVAAQRYALVARAAGLAFPDDAADQLEVIDRVPGSMTTQFGAPGAIPDRDAEPLEPKDAQRLASLVAASWTVFDAVVADAPSALRKGPRGGGRDRDRIVEHVLAAEAAYARKVGVRLPAPGPTDPDGIHAHRAAILEALRTGAHSPQADTKSGWPPRYAARRIAWHALDHAWEIQDRSPAATRGAASE